MRVSMMRWSLPAAAWAAVAAVWVGCSSGGAESDGGSAQVEERAEDAFVLPDEQIEATWVVHYAVSDRLGPLTDEGWVALINRRHLQQAVEASGADPVLAARAHLETALLYEQAAMIAANAFVEVYAKTPEATDPAGAQHLLAVSYIILGDLDKARAASAKLPEKDPTTPFHAPWKAWLADPAATWPPDLSALPLGLPEVSVATFPSLPPPPHYELPEQGSSDSKRTMADPGGLVALALWHRAAAAKASAEDAARFEAIRVGFALPLTAAPAKPGALTPQQLFGTTLLTPGDADFLVDLHGPTGKAAVDAHAGTSFLAWLAKDSRTDGHIDAEKAVQRVATLRMALMDAAKAKTGGTAEGHHRLFADLGTAGALWSLALVAEVEGDREVSGLLRLNARDKADLGNHLQDPVSLLSLAAWDAGNRNVHRAPELLHDQTRRYPDLEVARYGLDVLALRVQKERIEPSGM